MFGWLSEWPELGHGPTLLNKEDDECPESCADDDSLSTALPAKKR